MLEHVNNVEGLQNCDNDIAKLAAAAILAKWNDFVEGRLTRDQLSEAIDIIWTPEKNQELINTNSDGKLVHFANFAFNGIKTQPLDQHLPGTE